MHLKRQKVPSNWPIQRKGTKYIVRANLKLRDGVPILIFLRDMLKIAQNKKEVKSAIHSKHVLLNDKLINDEKRAVMLFDKITIIPTDKYYQLSISKNGKFEAEEIKEIESHQKIAKIINKKTLKHKKTQVNLSDGRNYLSDINCKINDSAVIDFKKNSIIRCLPLKENAKAMIFAGKHTGEIGVANKIELEKKIMEIDIEEKRINALIKQVIVIE